MWVQSLGQEDSLEKCMATHSSILSWGVQWTEEPGGHGPRGHKESDTTEMTWHMCKECRDSQDGNPLVEKAAGPPGLLPAEHDMGRRETQPGRARPERPSQREAWARRPHCKDSVPATHFSGVAFFLFFFLI